MTGPGISVIVCTRNRAPQLQRTLASLERMQYDGAWELIIVDNASSDETPVVMEAFERNHIGRTFCTVEPVPGLARARNRGLACATAPIVAFTDDDCYPQPDWLTRICTCFRENDRLGFLGGRILLFSPDDLPITIITETERREFLPGSLIPPGAIQGANVAFRRAALEQVEGFDNRLGPGTRYVCDDIDAVASISAAGWAGAYDPRPIVLHDHGRNRPMEGRALLHAYMRGAGAYYAKRLADPRTRVACIRHLARRVVTKPRFALHEVSGAVQFWRDGRREERRRT
jgi:glycosyltransferase involved in cell wall biosynthesis